MTYPPELEGGAAARCAVGLLRGLQAHGVECKALVDVAPTVPVTSAPGLAVEVVRVPPHSYLRSRLERTCRPWALYRSNLLEERLRAGAAEADIVHFFDVTTASALRVRDTPSLVQVHFLTLRDRQTASVRTKHGRDGLESLRIERRAVRRTSWLLANSPEVARPLATVAPRADVTVAPLALDPAHYKAQAQLDAPVAGLIGTALWPPTANAVRRLLRSVWPMVLQQRPDARLLLAGKGMERSAFADVAEVPGVQWRGTVASAGDFLRELGVLLYPLSFGSGTKVKVLESLALGVPVVTTPDGAEGLLGRGGVVVESEDRAIAAAVSDLLGDVGKRRAAGAAARAAFIEHHSPAVAAEPVVRLYERMLA
jgi:glycosyltransferase involved in cell wall biosynthesis